MYENDKGEKLFECHDACILYADKHHLYYMYRLCLDLHVYIKNVWCVSLCINSMLTVSL